MLLLNLIVLILSRILSLIYGYEALNLLLKFTPSRSSIFLLKNYGAVIGKRVTIQSPFIVHNGKKGKGMYQNLVIGDDCYIGRDCIFDLQDTIKIGDRVTISHRATLNTHTDKGKANIAVELNNKSSSQINIENDVYIGTNVTILQGVTIGKQSLIGAKSLVSKNLPEGSKSYGVPAKIISWNLIINIK